MAAEGWRRVRCQGNLISDAPGESVRQVYMARTCSIYTFYSSSSYSSSSWSHGFSLVFYPLSSTSYSSLSVYSLMVLLFSIILFFFLTPFLPPFPLPLPYFTCFSFGYFFLSFSCTIHFLSPHLSLFSLLSPLI